MGSSGSNHGARIISRHLKVLLPSSSQKLRISEELAWHLDGGDVGAGAAALLVSPFGSKVWRVEVGRDGDGAFLGRGWPEFVAAHGIGALWFVVFRHEGGGVLTVKAFDTTCRLREFTRPLDVAANQSISAGGGRCSRRPQFIKVLLRGFMEKMIIPAELVRHHIAEAETSSRPAVLLSLWGKYWRVEVDKDRPGNVFFSGGWSRFLESNGISQGEALLLRYEGNLVFTVKVFGLDGCQKSFKSQKGIGQMEQTDQMEHGQETKTEQGASSSSTSVRKRKTNDDERPSVGEKRRPTTSFTSPSDKITSASRNCSYKIGPPSWIKKEIKAYVLAHHLPVPPVFCRAIGLKKNACDITLRTSTDDGGATKSWQVRCSAYCRSSNQLGQGWKSFCKDNELKEGDVCTFNVVESTLWHVDIARRS